MGTNSAATRITWDKYETELVHWAAAICYVKHHPESDTLTVRKAATALHCGQQILPQHRHRIFVRGGTTFLRVVPDSLTLKVYALHRQPNRNWLT